MAAKKSTTKKKTSKKEEVIEEKNGKRQVTAIILFAVAIFLLILAIYPGGSGWYAIHCFLGGIFGISAYILPFVLIFIAVMSSMDKPMGSIKGKVIESVILMGLVSAAFEIFVASADESFWTSLKNGYIEGTLFKNGGIIGTIFGWPLERFLEDTGAKIVVALLVFVFFMLVTGTTLIGLFKNIWKPVKSTKDTIKDAFNERYSYDEEEEKTLPEDIEEERPRRRSRFIIEKEEAKPSCRTIDIEMGEGYHTIASDYENKKREVDQEIAEMTGKPIPEDPNESEDVKKLKKKFKALNEEEEPEQISKEEVKLATEEVKQEIEEIEEKKTYKYPPLSLLTATTNSSSKGGDSDQLQKTGDLLVQTLREFKIETRVVGVVVGPSVTRFELEPQAGIRVKRIAELADDISMRLATEGIRIEAPIPNKAAVGIEVPNDSTKMVGLRELLEDNKLASSSSKLMVGLGRAITGNIVEADLAKMPHLLIAGTTGSGKSVCTNAMILSILFRASPEDVKLILIDPKRVEFNAYNGIPHLLIPVVTDARKAAGALGWALQEMNKRYGILSDMGVRDIDEYNEKATKNPELEKMPKILVMIDEFADLMMTAGNEVEMSVNRIAQMGRAAGIHLVIATQRPSVDVITGLIKANIPSRLALTVASPIDSRTILETSGAEKLLGHGDMLFMPIGMSKPIRVQGCFVSQAEKEKVINFLKDNVEEAPTYDDEIMSEIERQAAATVKGSKSVSSEDIQVDGDSADEFLNKAIEIVVESGEASVSMIQRKLRVGYARAGRIIDEMEEKGIIGPHEGSKSRKVLITKEQWYEMMMNNEDDEVEE